MITQGKGLPDNKVVFFLNVKCPDFNFGDSFIQFYPGHRC